MQGTHQVTRRLGAPLHALTPTLALVRRQSKELRLASTSKKGSW